MKKAKLSKNNQRTILVCHGTGCVSGEAFEIREALETAVAKLGLKGVEILSNVNNRELDNPELLPFYKEAEALDVPVFIHPQIARSERIKKYHLFSKIYHKGLPVIVKTSQ